jgi:hypothetical protein
VDLGEAEGQVVGFRTGVDEVADGELVGHGADDAPRAQDDVVVQEAVVRVQDGHLPAAGFDDGGVAVAHWTKKNVQIGNERAEAQKNLQGDWR